MLNNTFWQERYLQNDTGWDIGQPSAPLKIYIDQLGNKNLNILIPGCGNSYEAEYIWQHGFKNIHLLDYAQQPLDNFKKRNPDFPEMNLHYEDFFNHKGTYDLIIEQTFFCAIDPALRTKYAEQMYSLLADSGKLVGVLFNRDFEKSGPPFGGTEVEYINYFQPYFDFHVFEKAYNSIEPRSGHELFMILKKRLLPSR